MDGDVVVRPMKMDDIDIGLLDTLDALRPASGMSKKKAAGIMERIASDENHLVAVAETGGKIVGTATILFELKLIYDGAMAGHIEDVAVRPEYQGRGVGGKIVRYLLDAARKRGCYKTVLHCEDSLVRYYTGLGFERASNGMRYNHVNTPP